jgi:ribosomal protein S17
LVERLVEGLVVTKASIGKYISIKNSKYYYFKRIKKYFKNNKKFFENTV